MSNRPGVTGDKKHRFEGRDSGLEVPAILVTTKEASLLTPVSRPLNVAPASPPRPDLMEPITERAGVPAKELGVYHAKLHIDLSIHDDASNTPLYFVNNSFWTRNTPDVTLHAGSDKAGPVLGVAKYTTFSSDMKVGLGDPNDADVSGLDVAWEDVTKESKVMHSSYRWSMRLPGTYERRTFIWKRTHRFGLENEHKSAYWATTNFKLADDRTGEIVANFANDGMKEWKKLGTFVFRAEYGQEWELMVLLTGLAVIEKARRRDRARR